MLDDIDVLNMLQCSQHMYDMIVDYRIKSQDFMVDDLLRYRSLHPLVSWLTLCEWIQFTHDRIIAAKPLNMRLTSDESTREAKTDTVIPASVTQLHA